MQLARINDGGMLELVPDTLIRVQSFPSNIKWVVLFGVGRAGKSTLCNLISTSNSVVGSRAFAVSNKSEPCTTGVWISQPIPQPTGEYLVVADTEGTEMIGDTKHQQKLLAFACLLACNGGVLVHNSWHYANSSLSTLAMMANSTTLLRGLDHDQFPFLGFLVRDFEQRVTVNGVAASLDEFLRDKVLADEGDKYDLERKSIRQAFANKKMLTTALLHKQERDYIDAHGVPLPDSDFKRDFDKFMNWLTAEAKVRKIGGVVCDSSGFASFLELFIRGINEEEHVEIPSVLESVMDPICQKKAHTAVRLYLDRMAQISNLAELEESVLKETHQTHHRAAQHLYTESTQGHYPKSVAKFLPEVSQKIGETFQATLISYAEERNRAQIVVYNNTVVSRSSQTCNHDYSTMQLVDKVDDTHVGRWGGFFYGHHCCGRCKGFPRCRKDCGGKCGMPRVIGKKVVYYCSKCLAIGGEKSVAT